MSKSYNYDRTTKEFLNETDASLDPLETELAGEDVFLLPANATFVAPPSVEANEMQVWDEEVESWEIQDDFRGTVHYDVDGVQSMIEVLDETVPVENTTTPPTEGLHKPFWNGSEWEESAIIYLDHAVNSKEAVDNVTASQIVRLEEAKVKTLKLIAGDGACPEWDTFVTARQALIDAGDQFIIDNELV